MFVLLVLSVMTHLIQRSECGVRCSCQRRNSVKVVAIQHWAAGGNQATHHQKPYQRAFRPYLKKINCTQMKPEGDRATEVPIQETCSWPPPVQQRQQIFAQSILSKSKRSSCILPDGNSPSSILLTTLRRWHVWSHDWALLPVPCCGVFYSTNLLIT